MNFSRIGFIGIFIIYFFLQAEGQSTEVIIKVKDTVSVGVPFILEIELKNIQGTFKTPDFNGLKMVGGPNTSSSFTMINGETTSKTKYSYYLMAESEGEYTVFIHELPSDDENIKFEEIRITALETAQNDSSIIKKYKSSGKEEIKPSSSKRKIKRL
ncbi:MAG: BatD family protein [Saprospiraceae bacterium]|nr:BatD family protein [Saprospiraceae bacterium]